LVILGGLVAIALFAALIGPYFINWNDYKGTFETEAEKILGQPVRVVGTASATLLPLPSLTFTQVQVGDTEGAPMMTVEHFDVTIELMPLLEGEIRVVSMKLDKPHVKISVDDSGTVDWLLRSEASKALNPEKVVLEDAEIVDGSVDYIDGSSGIKLSLDNINANIQADALTGPWKINGSYQQAGAPYQFDIATGKWAQGAIRVKTTLDPANVPFTLTGDGSIGSGKGGLSYSGTYTLTQVVATGEDGKPTGDGWHSEGAFNLSRDRVVIPKAVVSQGPPDRPASLAGSLVLNFGDQAKFTASVTARQLDLDRSLGKGPSQPVNVSQAAQSFVAWLSGLPVPPVPGNISFSVPAIVVGGAIVQDVSFDASPEPGGWQVDGFHAQLPGQATLDAAGTLTTGEKVGFGGQVHLAVAQPVGFASWWRGTRDVGAGRLLSPFDLAGRARIEVGRVAVDSMQIKIGDERIAGSFAWSGNGGNGGKRLLETDLKASRLDFTQIKALTELIIGQDLADTGVLADSYAINVAADELAIGDVTMHDVTADAGYVDGTLTVNGILIGDVGGTRVSVTRGEVQDIFTSPRGQLEAHLNAADVTGLAHFLDRLVPNTPLTAWLNAAAPALSPSALDAKIEAPARDGGADMRVVLHGSANATTFDAGLDLKGAPASWQTGDVTLTASLSSYDAMALAKQTGLDPAEVDQAGSAKLDFSGKGVPAEGLDAKLAGNFAGLEYGADGKLVLAEGGEPAFSGTFHLKSPDVRPLLTMARLQIPGVSGATSVGLDGTLASRGTTADVSWTNGAIAGRQLGGKLKLIAGEAVPRLDGEVSIDTVDFGWLTSLAVGYPMLPTGGDRPWPDTAFGDPTFAGLAGTIAFDAGRMTLTDGWDVSRAKLSFGLGQDRAELNLLAGEVAGGTVTGGLTIHNVGGNANVTGRLGINGANLESVVWQRGGRPVATGTIDLASTFEATGRSLAGLVSSLTGGGTIALHNGEARYINPDAASLVIRQMDVGQQLSDQALATQFATYMDGGALPFGEISGDFAIAAGTARLKSVAVEAAKTKSIGSAAVDLAGLAINSDWTMTFDPGDQKVEGATPQVGILFKGPLAAPARSFDLLPFSSYLNIRQEARLQEILSTQEAVRLEKERFTREKRKLKEDADRAAREAKEAADRRAAMLAEIGSFHEERETYVEQRAAEQLANARAAAAAAAKALADRAVADRDAAEEAAKQAEAALETAKGAAADAVQAVADRQAAEASASAAVVKASADAASARAAVEAAGGKVEEAEKALAAAKQAAADKAKALAEAEDAAKQAAADREAAEATVKAATGSASDAAAAVREARKSAEAKAAAVVAARRERDKTAKLSDGAAAAVTDAAKKKAEAERVLQQATADAAAAGAAATAAVKAHDDAAKSAADEADKVAAANAALSEAQKASDAAAARLEAATRAAEDAAKAAAEAEDRLRTLRADAAAKADASAAAGKAASEAEAAIAGAEDAAKTARSRADGLKLAADAAAKASAEAETKANGAKAAADLAAKDEAEKRKAADLAAAHAAEARKAADGAKLASESAAADLAKAQGLVAGLEAEATRREEAARQIPPEQVEALAKAASAAMQARLDADKARGALAKLQEDAGRAAAERSAKEEAAKSAEAGVAAPREAAEAAGQAASGAKAAYEQAAAEADKARGEAEAGQKALAQAISEADAAEAGAERAREALARAQDEAARAAAAAKAAADLIAPAEATVAKAVAERQSADKAADAAKAASAAASAALAARTAQRDKAVGAKADADVAEKVAAAKVDDASAAREKAAQAKDDATMVVATASKDYDAAVEAAASAKAAAEKAAADLNEAEAAAKAATEAVATAEAAAGSAGTDEAGARKRLADARVAVEAAAAAVKAASEAKDEADATVTEASDAVDAATTERDAAEKGTDEATAAETAARRTADAAKADRDAAEKAVEAADQAVAEAEAAARSARDKAAAKAEVAEAALKAAAEAAAIAGGKVAAKLPAAAIDAEETPAGDPAADGGIQVQPASVQPVPEPPMPPRRPPAKPAKKLPAPMPLNIVPQGAQ
jgi:hypothetical protein